MCFGGGGGSSTTVQTSQPSMDSAEAIREWVKSMPQVYETQMEYAPLQAESAIQLAQEYAQPYGEALLTAQKAMYPEEYALKETLTQQAQEGMQSQVPDWMRQQYLSNMNAQLGTNVGSGIGADYVSRGLLQQQQDWQRYYQNMAMSLAGSQPIYSASTPGTSDYMSGYTPNSVLGYYQGYGTTTSNTNTSGGNNWMSPLGSLLSGTGSLFSGLGWGQG